MDTIMFTIFLNEKTHFWEIVTDDIRGQKENIHNVSGGRQVWAMRDITKSLLKQGYSAAFRLDTGHTMKFFDDYEEMIGKWG